MNRTFAAVLFAGVVLLAGCSSTPDGPTEAEQRQSYCDAFARLTPGYLEISENTETLANPDSNSSDKSDALKSTLDSLGSGTKRTQPYDCNSPADKDRFDRFVARQKETASESEN